MRTLPVVIKIIFNIIFYIIYVIIFSLIFSILIGFLLRYFNKPLITDGSSIANTIQAIFSVIVLFITLVFRKYFYIGLSQNEEKKNEININLENNETKKEVKLDKEEKIILKDNIGDSELEIHIGKD